MKIGKLRILMNFNKPFLKFVRIRDFSESLKFLKLAFSISEANYAEFSEFQTKWLFFRHSTSFIGKPNQQLQGC